MARKTNKTDHVLSLLSNGHGKDEENQDSQLSEASLPPVEPDKVASVSVVKPSSEQLADTIKDSLEQELEEMEQEAQSAKEAEKEAEALTEATQKKAAAAEEAAAQEAEAEQDFEFVNVMEWLVRDKVEQYMTQFGICTCPRCVADTVALALTQLPPKYVVVSKAAVSPLMNFYVQKYVGQITVEITKACMTVGQNPHH